jgi:hypothetical protein
MAAFFSFPDISFSFFFCDHAEKSFVTTPLGTVTPGYRTPPDTKLPNVVIT